MEVLETDEGGDAEGQKHQLVLRDLEKLEVAQRPYLLHTHNPNITQRVLNKLTPPPSYLTTHTHTHTHTHSTNTSHIPLYTLGGINWTPLGAGQIKVS